MNKKVTSKDASYEISEPDEETKGEIYKLYQAIFESDLGDKKTKLLTYIFAWYPWSWRVVGISKGAYEKLKELNFYPKPKRLVRDHFLQDRKITYDQMISAVEILDKNSWWKLFWQNDQTVLMTKDEHDRDRSKVLCHQLNWKKGYFSCNPLIGFKYRKSYEARYLEENEKNMKWVNVETLKNKGVNY